MAKYKLIVTPYFGSHKEYLPARKEFFDFSMDLGRKPEEPFTDIEYGEIMGRVEKSGRFPGASGFILVRATELTEADN